jgi:cytochrome c
MACSSFEFYASGVVFALRLLMIRARGDRPARHSVGLTPPLLFFSLEGQNMKSLHALAAAFALSLASFALATHSAAAQDAEAGEKVFAKCRPCHMIGEGARNTVGPNLNGIVGRHSGVVADYNYSDANKESGIVWDVANLKEYLKNPKAKVPGTKMIFAGLAKDEDIDNLIAFLSKYDASGAKK